MKSTLLLFASILVFGAFTFSGTTEPIEPNSKALSADDKGIEFFHGTWKEALEKAKAENKTIFVDIYATWCGPCKMMSNYVFTQQDVGDFYNENFICVKLDAEKGEGTAVARKYRIMAYPTLLYVDGDGEIVHKTEGARSGNQFIDLGKKVLAKD